jgi:hypothetical protein
MRKRYIIEAVENGYLINLFVLGNSHGQWVAHSWKEVLEILEEIGAPDFEQENET